MPTLDARRLKADFPILARDVHPGVPLIYLDNAATTQKPTAVLTALDDYYRVHNANIHRGIHVLAEEATALYEGARDKVQAFINAASRREIIFTRNATEALNLIAYSWGRSQLRVGDLVVLSEMEHHANIVPWQILAAERGIELAYVPVTAEGRLDLEAYDALLARGPKLVSLLCVSNVLGTRNPVAELVRRAHAAGALIALDGAQAAPHEPVDVRALDCDFFVFSAHKLCGPTGIGVLYGRRALLEAMPPHYGGGDMIKRVTLSGFTPNELPHKFEAGTPAIAEGVGLGAAVDYMRALGMDAVRAHEAELVAYALERLEEVPGLTVYGPPAAERGGVAAFTLAGIHPHDIAQLLDADGIAIRAGHHCAMPLHERYGLPATARASFYIYNDTQDVDALVRSLYRAKERFGV